MPILKFSVGVDSILLDGFHIEDITSDKRTSLLNKKSFIRDEYRIDSNVYIALNDMFFKMAKIFNKGIHINAMLIRDEENYIIIVPSRSYVFWKGKSVDPVEYKIFQNEIDIVKLLKI